MRQVKSRRIPMLKMRSQKMFAVISVIFPPPPNKKKPIFSTQEFATSWVAGPFGSCVRACPGSRPQPKSHVETFDVFRRGSGVRNLCFFFFCVVCLNMCLKVESWFLLLADFFPTLLLFWSWVFLFLLMCGKYLPIRGKFQAMHRKKSGLSKAQCTLVVKNHGSKQKIHPAYLEDHPT